MACSKSRTPAHTRSTGKKMTPAKKLKFGSSFEGETQSLTATPSCSWTSGEDVSVESFDEWSSAEEHVTATASGGQGVVTETAVGDGAVTSTGSKRTRGLDTVDMSTVDTDKNNPVVGNMATEVRETLREDVE